MLVKTLLNAEASLKSKFPFSAYLWRPAAHHSEGMSLCTQDHMSVVSQPQCFCRKFCAVTKVYLVTPNDNFLLGVKNIIDSSPDFSKSNFALACRFSEMQNTDVPCTIADTFMTPHYSNFTITNVTHRPATNSSCTED
jgi:hypothetical protein